MSAGTESLRINEEKRSGHIVKVNGMYRIEGYMGLLREMLESARKFDPSIGPDMPPHCLDPVSISQLFRLPLEELAPWAVEDGDCQDGFSEDDRRDLKVTKTLVEKLIAGENTDSFLEQVAVDRAVASEASQAVQQEIDSIAVESGQHGDGSNDINGIDRIAQAIERITEHVVPEPQPIVGTPYVAERLGCTPTWITDLIRRGEIPKHCCVEGTGNGKPWKFHRRKIDQWLKSR